MCTFGLCVVKGLFIIHTVHKLWGEGGGQLPQCFPHLLDLPLAVCRSYTEGCTCGDEQTHRQFKGEKSIAANLSI